MEASKAENERQTTWASEYQKRQEAISARLGAFRRQIDEDPYSVLFGRASHRGVWNPWASLDWMLERQGGHHNGAEDPKMAGRAHKREAQVAPTEPAGCHETLTAIEEYDFDPISMRKVPRKQSKLAEAEVLKGNEDITEALNTKTLPPEVKASRNNKDLVQTRIKSENDRQDIHTANEAETEQCTLSRSTENAPKQRESNTSESLTHNIALDWLAQEKFTERSAQWKGRLEIGREKVRAERDATTESATSVPPTASKSPIMESALDRHLRDKGSAMKKKPDNSLEKGRDLDDGTAVEDLDILKPSDVRAAYSMAKGARLEPEKEEPVPNDHCREPDIDHGPYDETFLARASNAFLDLGIKSNHHHWERTRDSRASRRELAVQCQEYALKQLHPKTSKNIDRLLEKPPRSAANIEISCISLVRVGMKKVRLYRDRLGISTRRLKEIDDAVENWAHKRLSPLTPKPDPLYAVFDRPVKTIEDGQPTGFKAEAEKPTSRSIDDVSIAERPPDRADLLAFWRDYYNTGDRMDALRIKQRREQWVDMGGESWKPWNEFQDEVLTFGLHSSNLVPPKSQAFELRNTMQSLENQAAHVGQGMAAFVPSNDTKVKFEADSSPDNVKTRVRDTSDGMNKRSLESAERFPDRLGDDSAKQSLEQEVKAQKAAMDAAEHRTTTTASSNDSVAWDTPGEGDMSSSVVDYAYPDRWYKRKALCSSQKEDVVVSHGAKRELRDRAFIREIRKIYEDEYGTIDTKHRQPIGLPSFPAWWPRSAGRIRVRDFDTCDPLEHEHETMALPKTEDREGVDHQVAKAQVNAAPEVAAYHQGVGRVEEIGMTPLARAKDLFKQTTEMEERTKAALKTVQEMLATRVANQETKAETPSPVNKPVLQSSTVATYKILALDLDTKKITRATIIQPVNLNEKADAPSKIVNSIWNFPQFIPHIDILQKAGYTLISGKGTKMVFKKERLVPSKLATTDTSVREEWEDENLPSIEKTEEQQQDPYVHSFQTPNPIDGTTTTRTVNFSPTGFVNYSSLPDTTESEPPSAASRAPLPLSTSLNSSERVRREEPVFSGDRQPSQKSHRPYQGIERVGGHSGKNRHGHHGRRHGKGRRNATRTAKRVFWVGVWVAGCTYATGVVLEFFRTGGTGGLGAVGFGAI